MKLGTKVKPLNSKPGIAYKVIKDMGAEYYLLKNGDREFIDHIDNLRRIK